MGRRPKYANLEEAYRGKNARRRERRANASTMDNSGTAATTQFRVSIKESFNSRSTMELRYKSWHQGIKRIPRNSNACQATSCEEELKLTPSAGTTPNQLMNAENSEFPEYFKWNQQSKIWKERKQRKVIGRILGAHLSEGESPRNPAQLWLQFQDFLSEDIKRDSSIPIHLVEVKVLQCIDNYLQSMEKSLADYQLNTPQIQQS
ncbi:uncharacterized protein [Coffea arabica]|uniref:Uncharacterized protein isoform X3 n=1 Tax=Coffea arabica TaxID=13443 RepID=A0ABM4WL48_COFAR